MRRPSVSVHMDLLTKINRANVPQHVAIIMDGNGRWARQRGKARIFGHQNAIESVRESVKGCMEAGVKYLTLYAFSTENWRRPQQEVRALMELLVHVISNESAELNKNNISLHTIGDIQSLGKQCYEELGSAKKLMVNNNGLNLILALNYSARWELVQAAKKISLDAKAGKISPDRLDEKSFGSYLETAAFPDPELLIRTSGESRISNFLLWQLAYAEFHFTKKLWPDFRREDLFQAIIDYQQRERRFGMTGEQIKAV